MIDNRLSFEILQTCGACLQALFLIIVSLEMLNMIRKSEVPKDMLVVDGIEDLKSNLMMKCIDGHLG